MFISSGVVRKSEPMTAAGVATIVYTRRFGDRGLLCAAAADCDKWYWMCIAWAKA